MAEERPEQESQAEAAPHQRARVNISLRDATPLSPKQERRALRILLTILVVFATLTILYFARSLLVPITAAVLLAFLFKPFARKFNRIRIPYWVSAFVIVILLASVAGGAIYVSSGPVARWLERAPEELRELEYKLRGIKEPVDKITKATETISDAADVDGDETPVVEVRPQSLTSILLNQTMAAAMAIVVMFVLMFFLIASGDLFLRKFVYMLPKLNEKKKAIHAFRQLEEDISHYLIVHTLINATLGVVVGVSFYFLGMPNALVWGLLAGLLNYIVYVGPVVFIALALLFGLVHFDSVWQALVPAAVFSVINLLEAYIFSPWLIGRRLELNPVAVFLALVFWGWLWGVPGALMAVPLLVCLRIAGRHIQTLEPVALFLGRELPRVNNGAEQQDDATDN